jgi:hypothetical protein
MAMLVPKQRDAVVHQALVSTSHRLQELWEEALLHSQLSPPVSAQREQWESAAERLVDAMEAVERFAGTVDPLLGRRDWRTRCQGASQGATFDR